MCRQVQAVALLSKNKSDQTQRRDEFYALFREERPMTDSKNSTERRALFLSLSRHQEPAIIVAATQFVFFLTRGDRAPWSWIEMGCFL
jgi:hypothetical protein